MLRTLQLVICLTAIAASEHQYRGYYQNYEHPRSASSLTKRGVAEPEGGQITFEGPTADRRKPKPKGFQPEITDECKRLGYCPSVPNYPDDFVRRLLDELPDKSIFSMDQLDNPLAESNATVDIVSRLGGTGSQATVPLCVASDQLIYPQAAPDEGNTWRPIVNLKDNPVQGLRAEICSNPGNQCSKIMSLENGYSSECQQKYVYRMVATIDNASNSIMNRPLRFPSCCSCVIHIV